MPVYLVHTLYLSVAVNDGKYCTFGRVQRAITATNCGKFATESRRIRQNCGIPTLQWASCQAQVSTSTLYHK